MASSAAKKLRLDFSREETERFVAHYLSHESLWNVSSNDYSKRDERNAALTAICLAFPEKSLTTDQYISKYDQVTSNIARELRKRLASKTSGSASDAVYIPVWDHFEALDPFLRPHMRQRASVNNFTRQESSNRLVEESQDEVQLAIEDNNTPSEYETTAALAPSNPPLRKITSKLNHQDRFREALVSSLSALANKPTGDNPGRNKQFLLHLGEVNNQVWTRQSSD
ncbi:uncharacterized protein [Haliotis cracherodii]|uniref:uncharacterized protein n=1 Tax=Haliotis cracherodii TaxID=6455 RepID=UPI0039EC71D2